MEVCGNLGPMWHSFWMLCVLACILALINWLILAGRFAVSVHFLGYSVGVILVFLSAAEVFCG